MIFLSACYAALLSSAIGLHFASKYPNNKKLWATVDFLWILVAGLAFLYMVKTIHVPLTHVDKEIAINNIAQLSGDLKHKAYLLEKKYCSNKGYNLQPTIPHVKYCENLRDVIFYSGVPHLTYLYIKDLGEKFEQLKTEYYPKDSVKFTLALANYINIYNSKESQLNPMPYEKLEELSDKYEWYEFFLIIFVVVFGFRIGKSCKDFFVTPAPPII